MLNRVVSRGKLTVTLVVVFLLAALASIYAVSANHSAGGGPEWRPDGLQGLLVHSITVSSRKAGPEFAGTHDGVYRRNGRGPWRRVFSDVDIWAVDLLPDDRTVLAADNNGDIAITRDTGARWVRRRVAANGAYAVSAAPGDARRILLGGAGGVYLSQDAGAHWERRLYLPGSAAAAFSWLPGSSQTVFAGAVAGTAHGSTGVYVSHDAGSTWYEFGRGLNSTGGIMALTVSSSSDVFGGTMGNAAWLAGHASHVWRKIATGMPATHDHVATLLRLPVTRTLFAGTLGFGVFRSRDAGGHWDAISTGLPSAQYATTVLSVAWDPAHGALLAGTADGIYRLQAG